MNPNNMIFFSSALPVFTKKMKIQLVFMHYVLSASMCMVSYIYHVFGFLLVNL